MNISCNVLYVSLLHHCKVEKLLNQTIISWEPSAIIEANVAVDENIDINVDIGKNKAIG